MNWIDITCLIIIFLFTFLGIWAGLFKSVFKLVAWLLAALGAYFGYDIAGASSLLTLIFLKHLFE